MNVNPAKWFGIRELDKVPPHFIKSTSPLTEKSKLWVITKLQGRYAIAESNEGDDMFGLMPTEHIYFEDPSEATMYELRWSGSK